MLREFSRDPHVLKASRIDAVYGLVTLMDQAYDAADDLDGPVLYLYGRNDQIVPAAPTYRVMGRIRAERRLVVYENGYHMLESLVVFADIGGINFLKVCTQGISQLSGARTHIQYTARMLDLCHQIRNKCFRIRGPESGVLR